MIIQLALGHDDLLLAMLTTRESMEWLDAQDPEMLYATLAMVEDWCSAQGQPESTIPCTSGSGSDESTRDEDDPRPCKRRTTGRSINISRERRKQDLVALREQAYHLKEQLRTLQQRREKQLAAHYDGGSGRIVTTAPVWEGLARRQYEARKRSETINQELKRRLDVQVQIAQGLLQLIQRAEKERQNGLAMVPSTRVQVPIDISLRLSDEEMARRISWIVAQTPTAFARNERFMGREVNFYESRVVHQTLDSVVLEVFACSPLPYSVHEIAHALWSIWNTEENVTDDDEFNQDTTHATNDTVHGVFTAKYRTSGVRGTFNGKFVTKRYAPCATQRALATFSYSEPEGYHPDVDGVMVSEDSWLRLVNASELGHQHLNGPLTLLQFVRRTSVSLKQRRDEEHIIEKLTKFFLTQLRDEVRTSQKGLENFLLQPKQITPGPCGGDVFAI